MNKTRVAIILFGVALILGRKALRRLLARLFSIQKQPLRVLPWLDDTYGGQMAAHVLKEHGVKVSCARARPVSLCSPKKKKRPSSR